MLTPFELITALVDQPHGGIGEGKVAVHTVNSGGTSWELVRNMFEGTILSTSPVPECDAPRAFAHAEDAAPSPPTWERFTVPIDQVWKGRGDTFESALDALRARINERLTTYKMPLTKQTHVVLAREAEIKIAEGSGDGQRWRAVEVAVKGGFAYIPARVKAP